MDLSDVEDAIRHGMNVEDVLAEYGWKDFEQAVASIFEENGFIVTRDLRFKAERRHQVDVLAVGGGHAYCVDCKQWREGRPKSSALETAAKDQAERACQLAVFLRGNPIAGSKLHMQGIKTAEPLLVTLLDEAVRESEDGVKIVPLWKLNSFLNSQ